ncbi:MAG TPA: hypothetical protein VNL13_00620 [Sulfolobales archaeon]|nr:hypothetical protein [Sulfolobales archaeon]
MSSDPKTGAGKKGVNAEILVGAASIIFLALIGLLAVLELGPPRIMIYTGASPLNTGLLGASDLYSETKGMYPNTIIITNWSMVRNIIAGCKNAVLITISPEIPYSSYEAEEIVRQLSQCGSLGLLVADESGNANPLLEAIGSRIRVEGTRILDLSTGLPYPTAVFNTSWGYGDRVTLDIASRLIVTGSGSQGHEIFVSGVVPAAYIVNQTESPQISTQRIYLDAAIAMEERFGSISVFAIGDGSIFLNQVMRSQYRDRYLELYEGALKHLCKDNADCMVLMDASKYIGGDPASLINRGVNPALLVTPEFLASAIARIIHPATWFPPLISQADNTLRGLITISNLAKILIISTSVLVISLVMLSKTPTRRVDTAIEVGSISPGELVGGKGVKDLGGRKLGRKDFLEVYRAIDEIIYSVTGTRLSEPGCGRRLTEMGVDRDLAEGFCKYMRRTALRARLRRPYPLILRWSRAIERAIDMYHEISISIDMARTIRREHL